MPPVRVVAIIEASVVTGPAKNLIAFSRYARELGLVDLSFVTFVRGSAGTNAFIEAARSAGTAVHTISERRAFDSGVLGKLKAVITSANPDIIQTHAVKSHLLLRLSGLHRRYPWIAFHHGYTAENRKVKMYNQFDRVSLRAADHLVTVCEPFAEQIRAIGVDPERITVRHNIIRPAEPAPPGAAEALRAELGIPPEAPVLLCVGRLSSEKGQMHLLRAVSLLKKPVRAVLVGDGVQRAAIQAYAREQNIADQIILAGHRSDVRPFYAMTDIVVIPSLSEGSPNVLLEALAAGCPVVATAVGGIPEIVQDGENALLVPAGDPVQLAAAIERISTDADLRRRLAAAGPAVASRFTPEAYCRAVTGVYERVLNSRTRTT